MAHSLRQKKLKQAAMVHFLDVLAAYDVQFEQLSDYHFRYEDWDFWPSSMKFYNRVTNYKGLGVWDFLSKLGIR